MQVDGHGDPWLFRGGFLAVDFATILVIVAVTHRGAKMGLFLGNPVLDWIGTRSYGLYLYHWPIYQIIRGKAGAHLTVPEFVVAMVFTVHRHRALLPVRRDADPPAPARSLVQPGPRCR